MSPDQNCHPKAQVHFMAGYAEYITDQKHDGQNGDKWMMRLVLDAKYRETTGHWFLICVHALANCSNSDMNRCKNTKEWNGLEIWLGKDLSFGARNLNRVYALVKASKYYIREEGTQEFKCNTILRHTFCFSIWRWKTGTKGIGSPPPKV